MILTKNNTLLFQDGSKPDGEQEIISPLEQLNERSLTSTVQLGHVL